MTFLEETAGSSLNSTRKTIRNPLSSRKLHRQSSGFPLNEISEAKAPPTRYSRSERWNSDKEKKKKRKDSIWLNQVQSASFPKFIIDFFITERNKATESSMLFCLGIMKKVSYPQKQNKWICRKGGGRVSALYSLSNNTWHWTMTTSMVCIVFQSLSLKLSGAKFLFMKVFPLFRKKDRTSALL